MSIKIKTAITSSLIVFAIGCKSNTNGFGNSDEQTNIQSLGSDISPDTVILKFRDGFSDGRPKKKVEVKDFQKMLSDVGFDVDIDGYYGNGTVSVVEQLQSQQGMPVDGENVTKALIDVVKALLGNTLTPVSAGDIDFQETVKRTMNITTQPKYEGVSSSSASTTKYTDYTVSNNSLAAQAVMDVSNNGSFVSKVLRVVTRDGKSKNFYTITGQDGLTFGITDFATNAGILSFFKRMSATHWDYMNAAFGEENAKKLLDSSWHKQMNPHDKGKLANDNGLIRLKWFRIGLDKILSDPRLFSMQLANFKSGKIDGSLKVFKENHFTQEFTLGTMIGVANSAGTGGMRTMLKSSISSVDYEYPSLINGDSSDKLKRERLISKKLLEKYVLADPHPRDNDSLLLKQGFAGDSLTSSSIGHRGRRARELFTKFSYTEKIEFTGLGEFNFVSNQF